MQGLWILEGEYPVNISSVYKCNRDFQIYKNPWTTIHKKMPLKLLLVSKIKSTKRRIIKTKNIAMEELFNQKTSIEPI